MPIPSHVWKVLASPAKFRVLKSLAECNRITATQLAKELNLNKKTVHQHLQDLLSLELVDRDDAHRQWIYYSLRPEMRSVFYPQNVHSLLI